jgi:hypothetical protein
LPSRRAAALLVSTLTLALAGCGLFATPPSPSTSAPDSTNEIDLSAIACATDDPDGSGELTGAWSGTDGGVYYIRQVGDCAWWFATTLDNLTSGRTGQLGLSNVSSGRIQGTHIEVEYVDLPAGEAPGGGGGLTLVYDPENDELEITEQRGGWLQYAANRLTRIKPAATPEASPSS